MLVTLQACSYSDKQPHQTTQAGDATETDAGSNGQHGAVNAELQQLWEDAQAAMQHSQAADCCQGGAVQQLFEVSAAESSQVLDPMSSCANELAPMADQVHTSALSL